MGRKGNAMALIVILIGAGAAYMVLQDDSGGSSSDYGNLDEDAKKLFSGSDGGSDGGSNPATDCSAGCAASSDCVASADGYCEIGRCCYTSCGDLNSAECTSSDDCTWEPQFGVCVSS